MKKKKYIILAVLVVAMVAIRLALPPLILKTANNYLKDFSPVVSVHIGDIDLGIIRGAYQAEDVTVKLKSNDKQILKVGSSEISLAWSELLKGKVLARVKVEEADMLYSTAILNELKKIPKNEARVAKEKAIPVEVESFELKKSRVTLEDYPGFKAGEKLRIQDINSKVTNLTPNKDFPYSFYNVTASIQGATPVKAAGKVNLLAKPLEWDVDADLRAFNLTTANPLLKQKVPLTFTTGSLDLFAEASSENGKVEGYVKPFLKNLDIVKTDENFKGPRHWAIEVITAITNIVLKDEKIDSMATRVPFKYEDSVKVDTGEALEKAIQHGFEEDLKPGVENKYDIE